MSTALLVVGGLFLVVYAPLAVLAWRRRLLVRLAVRESVRRPAQLALITCGLLIGTAAITASLVSADSDRDTMVLWAYHGWGRVDLTVHANGHMFSAAVADRLAGEAALAPYVDGVQAGLELPVSVADLDQRVSSSTLFVGFDPRAQGAFGAYALAGGRVTFGDDLAAGEVLLSQRLAGRLNARIGDRLRITAGLPGDGAEERVAGIATAGGPGAYGDENEFAIYVPLSTAQRLTANDGINVVRISARGGHTVGLEAADRAVAPLRSVVSRLSADTPLQVRQTKRQSLQTAEHATQFVLATLLVMSVLVVVAGLVLIVNLMLALADERRQQAATLRALGLGRSGLIAVVVLEGAVYSLVAAASGVFVGILGARVLAAQFFDILGHHPDFGLAFSVYPETLAIAFASGAILTLATLAAAGYRTSRMSIAAAIKDLPEPATTDRRAWLGRLVAFALIGLGTAATLYTDPLARMSGGVALISGAALLSRGLLRDRVWATLTGLLLSTWVAIVMGSVTFDDLRAFPVLVVGCLVAVFGLCTVAAANLRVLEAGLGLLGSNFGRMQAALWPPIAQLSRRPMRTGLAAGTFALVMVIVTGIAIAAAGYRPDYLRDSGGYDIQVVSPADRMQLPAEIQQQVAGRVDFPIRLYVGPMQGALWDANGDSVSIRFIALSDDLLKKPPLYLASREPSFASDEQVWQAMERGDDLVINGDAGLGNDVVVQGLHGPVRLRTVASPPAGILPGLVVSSSTLAKLDTMPLGTVSFLKAMPGVDPAELARQMQRSMFSEGVQVVTLRELLDQGSAATLVWVGWFDTILRMGLLIGALSLAVVALRAAVERRRTIGIMRSLGYQPPRVLAGLVVEAALTATIGALIGIAAGLFLGFELARGSAAGMAFKIDSERMAVALAIVYSTALSVTAALALRAARMRPVDALRHTG